MADETDIDFAVKPEEEDDPEAGLFGSTSGGMLKSLSTELGRSRDQAVQSRKALWDAYGASLRARRSGELDKSDRIINALQAFATPRRGGVWQDLNALNTQLSTDTRANRKAASEREASLAEMGFKRDMDLASLGEKYDTEGRNLRSGVLTTQMKGEAALAKANAAAAARGDVVFDSLGRARERDTGAIIPIPGQGSGFTDETRNGVVGYKDPSGKWTPYPETAQPTRGLPGRLAQVEEDDIAALGALSSSQADVSALQQQIKDKSLDLSLLGNVANTAKNALGIGGEEGAKYATFKTTLEKLRNDSLLLAKGVQTEGDAQRAWNALFSSISDPVVVAAQLAKVAEINRRSAQLKATRIQQRRKERGLQPTDLSGYIDVPSAVTGGATSGAPVDLGQFYKKGN